MTGSVAAIVVAAGRGLRAGGPLAKQYRTIAGEPVIRMSLALFAEHSEVALVQPVIHPDDRELFAVAAAELKLAPPVLGGATRQASVRAGLQALEPRAPDIVLIHDAARPFASPALLSRAIAAAEAATAAIPGLPVVDTVKAVDAEGRITATLDRDGLRTVQTPQAFAFDRILDAHRRAQAAGREDFTDDAALAEWAGMAVTVFEGEAGNVKLTSADDFQRAERERSRRLSDVRTATGFDVHAFGEGDHVMIAGVRIPHARGLTGHSDADVALHALTDAVLGAIADGDIGAHFPPSDPQWRGVSSDRFLAFAVERVRVRGGRIAALDLTLLCESPRIGPHRDAMRARIASIAGIAQSRVAVKATTTERLGFLGRGEGIAALATATVRLPGDADD
jgi:2-C-methyl-D-erythritol 4-phosphate cytidylyltransferase / 2-C-methyl-D-erythritol 2,4-cyclodiphosphate synthase